METNATRMCALLVGLPDIRVLGVEDQPGQPLRVHVETTVELEGCAGCGTRAWVKDRPTVELVDLPAFGRSAVLVWRKRRWRCPEAACPVGTWTETDPRIAPARGTMTDRAGRWVTGQVGHVYRHARGAHVVVADSRVTRFGPFVNTTASATWSLRIDGLCSCSSVTSTTVCGYRRRESFERRFSAYARTESETESWRALTWSCIALLVPSRVR